VLTEENHCGVLTRAEGKSQEEAQLLALEYRPRPVPRDVVRAFSVVPAETKQRVEGPLDGARAHEPVTPPRPPEVVKPLTPELRRLNVTVSAEFIAELEQVRAALSHQCPDGDFEQVVREAFKLVLERCCVFDPYRSCQASIVYVPTPRLPRRKRPRRRHVRVAEVVAGDDVAPHPRLTSRPQFDDTRLFQRSSTPAERGGWRMASSRLQ
jgi:hypothetical protein